MTTITTAGKTITPLLVLGYESSRQAQTIVHDVLGGGDDVLLLPAQRRSGTLRMLFATEAQAANAETLHAAAATFTLTDTDVATVSMTYAVVGTIARSLNEDRTTWQVEVGYREVSP